MLMIPVMAAEPDTSEINAEDADIAVEEYNDEVTSDEISPDEDSYGIVIGADEDGETLPEVNTDVMGDAGESCAEEEIISEGSLAEDGEAETFFELGDGNYVPDADALADSDELFSEYADRVFYGDSGIAALANYGSKILDKQSLAIYNQLKEAVTEVAEGSRTSTVVNVDVEGLKWTLKELGIDSTGKVKETVEEEIDEAVKARLETILDCLMVDCPYELYWFDKTTGFIYKYGITEYISTADGSITSAGLYSLSVTFRVSPDYQNGGDSTVNTAKTHAAQSAAANAQSIAAKYTSCTDREKMTKYKDEICALVSFDNSVSDTSYGDPWQIIYVFDGDSSTNVTCEGYAKAFQYLCDLGLTDSTSYLVKGNMTGTTGAGNHMWNVVSLEGGSYLVDVTNSDTGKVGDNGELFLVDASDAASAVPGIEYAFRIGSTTVTYTYDDSTISLYSDSIRTLSGSTNSDGTKSDTGTTAAAATVKKASDGKWYYYVNGKKDTSYTGFASNENGKWYVEKGLVTKSTNGVFKDKTGAIGSSGEWYYVLNSKVQTGFTGLADYRNDSGWWYITKGKVDRSANTIAKNKNGWWYVRNGKVDKSYTGFGTNSNGKWYVKSGKVSKKENGVFKDSTGAVGAKNNWYYVLNSKVQSGFTGLADYRNASGWWYITKGKVDRSYNGLAKNKNGWFYLTNGKVNRSFTGLAANSSGTWYVKAGKVQKSYTGTVTINGKRYSVTKGKIK